MVDFAPVTRVLTQSVGTHPRRERVAKEIARLDHYAVPIFGSARIIGRTATYLKPVLGTQLSVPRTKVNRITPDAGGLVTLSIDSTPDWNHSRFGRQAEATVTFVSGREMTRRVQRPSGQSANPIVCADVLIDVALNFTDLDFPRDPDEQVRRVPRLA